MNESSLDKLLNEMLMRPQSDAASQIAQLIETNEGYNLFLASLSANNALAYIYLKHNIKAWIRDTKNEKYYNEKFIQYACEVVETRNKEFLCEYLHTLSLEKKVSTELTVYFINRQNYSYLRAIFKKFIEEQRSNALYEEINTAMALMEPVLNKVYCDEKIAEILAKCPEQITTAEAVQQAIQVSTDFNNCDLLEAVYCLLGQDIPAYFEDHAEYFFKVFYVLYGQQREIVLRIFDLFATKYPEYTNIQLLLNALAEDTQTDSAVIGVLTKAAQHTDVDNAAVRIVLSRALVHRINCTDMVTYTKDILTGTDIDRGATVRLIRLLRPAEDYFLDCGLEPRLFVATVLKMRSEELVIFCRKFILSADQNNLNYSNCDKLNNDDITLGFAAFHYLITLGEFGPCSLNFLNGDLRFICLKYMSLSLRSLDRFHTNALLGRLSLDAKQIAVSPLLNEDSIREFYSQDFCRSIVASITDNYRNWPDGPVVDEFSAEFLFRIVQFHTELATPALHRFISFIFTSIERVEMQSLNFLFDTYLFLTNRLSIVDLKFAEHIINNELTDQYPHCFFYLSILIQSGNAPPDFVVDVLSQDVLWKEPLCVPSLVFLTISAFNNNLISSDQVIAFSKVLTPFYAFLLLYKCSVPHPTNSPIENFLLNNIFDSDWFLANFVDKKYARLVLKKIAVAPVQQDIRNFVIQKNIINIEHEYTYRSIIEFFDA